MPSPSQASSYCKALAAQSAQGVPGGGSQQCLPEQRHQIVSPTSHSEGRLRGPELLADKSGNSKILQQLLDPILAISPSLIKRSDLLDGQVQVRDVNCVGVAGHFQ